MRHRRKRKNLSRTTSHRKALYSNMISSLFEHGRVQTTERKGKDLRRYAERAITRATSLGPEILNKRPENLDTEDRARLIHAMRMSRRTLDRDTVLELYRFIAPRYLGRPGGYTRTFKMGNRRGDGAPMVLVELIDAPMPVDSEWRVAEEDSEEGGTEQKKGFFSRFRKG